MSVQIEPRSAIERLRSAFAVRISLKQLSLFAGNLATCLGAGLALPVSLETSHRSCQNRTMRRIAMSAAERVREGMELSDALEADAGTSRRSSCPCCVAASDPAACPRPCGTWKGTAGSWRGRIA